MRYAIKSNARKTRKNRVSAAKFCILASTLIMLAICRNLTAADWVLEQTATITATTVELTQRHSNSSHQGLNGVLLNTNEDSLSALTQRANIGATQLTLTQDGAIANSNVQSVNIATAQSIDQLNQSVSQLSGRANLQQNMVSGSGNIQAINYAFASNSINAATQSFTGQALTLEKTASTPLGNIQAVNYARAAHYSGNILQTVTLDSLTYENRSGDVNGIRINSLQGNIDNAAVTQTVTVRGVLTVDPSSATSVIINHIAQ